MSAMHPGTVWQVCPTCEGTKELTDAHGTTHGCGACVALGGHWVTVEPPPDALPTLDAPPPEETP